MAIDAGMRLGSIAGIRALAPDVRYAAGLIHEQLHGAGLPPRLGPLSA